ncbi:MAG: hypothetical protein O2960_12855 [Verrucomicrobia bacterium]|nr:hypothetical protein [Verrucomicrobiota bacterium]
MYYELINQHLHVASREGARRVVAMDKDFWSVVSISGPSEPLNELPSAKRILRAVFDDTEIADESNALIPPRSEDLRSIFQFIDEVPGAPLLIHCQVGISRSAAVALALICREIPKEEGFWDRAVDTLLDIRPQAKPNALVLRLGLELFMPLGEAGRHATNLINHPRLFANRFRPNEE